MCALASLSLSLAVFLHFVIFKTVPANTVNDGFQANVNHYSYRFYSFCFTSFLFYFFWLKKKRIYFEPEIVGLNLSLNLPVQNYLRSSRLTIVVVEQDSVNELGIPSVQLLSWLPSIDLADVKMQFYAAFFTIGCLYFPFKFQFRISWPRTSKCCCIPVKLNMNLNHLNATEWSIHGLMLFRGTEWFLIWKRKFTPALPAWICRPLIAKFIILLFPHFVFFPLCSISHKKFTRLYNLQKWLLMNRIIANTAQAAKHGMTISKNFF